MATAQFVPMGPSSNLFKSELDMDTFFDFNQDTPKAPSRHSSSAGPSKPTIYQSAPSPAEETEGQIFAGPSHEYDRFKQQTGLPIGGLSHLNQPMPSSFGGNELFPSFNSGLDDGFNSGFDNSWSTGLDMDTDMGADFGVNQIPTMFFSPADQGQNNNGFVDPTSIDSVEEPQSNVGRLWPGMHQQQAQQAAMAKALNQQRQQQQQQHLQHQHQQQQQQQQQQRLEQHQAANRSRASSNVSYQSDRHTEESISRLLNRMRQGSMVSTNDDEDGPNGLLPHVQRMRKDEEDMDEDERLLASEEGKKLSSKERRQLRNKVSARAFRSRRKEYIGQLEGEIAVKAQEASSLKSENTTLLEENARYRSLIQTLLRHPAFVPYIDEISKDPSLIAPLPQQHVQQQQQQQQQQRSAATTPMPQYAVPAQQPMQQQVQMPKQQEGHHIGMTMIPEAAPVDLSMLNINNNGYPGQQRRHSFQRPQVYSVHDMPQGPSPLDLALDVATKQHDSKSDFPSFNRLPSTAASNTSYNTGLDEYSMYNKS